MKLTTCNTNILVLFSIILNSVLNANSLKRPNIETIKNKKDTSNIQIRLNNTSNQISLVFEEKENLNFKTEKDEDRHALKKSQKSSSQVVNLSSLALENIQEKLIVNSKEINSEGNNNSYEPQEEGLFPSNLNNEIKENLNLKEKKQQELQNKSKKFNINIKNIKENKHLLNNQENQKNSLRSNIEDSFQDATYVTKDPNDTQLKPSYPNPKKIKYFEALKNIKKIKNRLSNFKSLNTFNTADNPNNNHLSNDQNKENILGDLDINISLNDLSKITEANIKDEILFEEFLNQKGSSLKKKYLDKDDNNSILFYNSISLIMLSMLGGGVVGVVFILYFTFKNKSSNNRYE